jgi:DNA polymerase elongation subunit (family B)
MERFNFFPYSWFIDDGEEDFTAIRIYALGEKNENICVIINDFNPYVYLELPTEFDWNQSRANLVRDKIKKVLGNENSLQECKLVMKKKLYYAHLTKDNKPKLFPFLFCSFRKVKDIRNLFFKLKNAFQVIGIGFINLKMHEQDANPILQLCSNQNLPSAGWIKSAGKKVEKENMITLCDMEYIVQYKNMQKLNRNTVGKPKIMGFDIEVNSSNPSAMPKAERPMDKVFQISCVFTREGGDEKDYEKFLLSLGFPDPDKVGSDVTIYSYENENDLLVGFTDLIRELNPNVIVGYNILGFDIPYMIARTKHFTSTNEFSRQGFHRWNVAQLKTIKWSSSAYKNQEFQFLDAEGRLFIDLLPLVKRDYKLDNYKLKTVSEYFLKDTKIDLSPKGIFKCYRLGMKGGKKGEKALGICGAYCIMDSILVVKLMEKLQIWVGLTEMAVVCNVQPFTLYTQGQQIKVYSQVYKYCLENNFVVEKDGYITPENERYTGAHVFEPIPGLYDNVVPLDFNSMYPNTIIAYNLDYSTLAIDENIPDSSCHIMEFEDHVFCPHDPKIIRKNKLDFYIESKKEEIKKLRTKRDSIKDKNKKAEFNKDIDVITQDLKPYQEERSNIVKSKPKFTMCEKRRYRFLKEPKGVMPTVLENLLNARKKTRQEIKNIKEELKSTSDSSKIKEFQLLLNVLDKRQLAFKVSANSMYGSMGVKRGMLCFMPGAMCCTYKCRENIKIVAKSIPEKFKGTLVYGDTDSSYVCFPHLSSSEELWDYSIDVAKKISAMFPPPLRIEFEEVIYKTFFILTKKRYMYLSSSRNGDVDKSKIGKKGVLLSRRDNSPIIRKIYETVISKLFDKQTKDAIYLFLIDEINKVFGNFFDYKQFVITKSVGDINNLESIEVLNEKGVAKAKCGDYTLPLLLKGEEKAKQLAKKEAVNDRDFYLKCLPGAPQLAEKMRSRGCRIDAGTRLEYVIIESEDNLKDKTSEKMESADYYATYKQILKIDFLYYLKLLINPLDQVLHVAFKEKDFTLKQYKYRVLKSKLLDQLKDLFRPKLIFKEK